MALSVNEQARMEANLRLLQRSTDNTITNILGTATHVVLYKFQQSTQSWEKSNVEGSLFLAVRPMGYLLLILNRNSPENYQLSVNKDFQLQHKDPYLIFKQHEEGATVIRGIWFPDAQERAIMNGLLTQVLQLLRTNPPVSAPAPTPAPAVASIDQGAAIAALLSPFSLGTNDATSAVPTSGVTRNGAIPTITTTSAASNTPPSRQLSPSTGQAPVLDKKSLQLALLSLIQDERFLDLLHAQYLKVSQARADRSRNE
jgi:mRNA-decapping enzyme 1B